MTTTIPLFRRLCLLCLSGALLLCFAIPGCGPKVSQSSFDKITNDMTEQQVQDLLGKPTETSGGSLGSLSAKKETWTDGSKSITVTFLNGKVEGKTSKNL